MEVNKWKSIDKNRQFALELCHSYGSGYHIILYDYNQSGDDDPWPFGMAILTIWSSAVFFELMAYVRFFQTIRDHDMEVARILTAQENKQRRNRSAISFACAMYIFAINTIFIFLLALTSEQVKKINPKISINSQHAKAYTLIAKQFELAFTSTFEAMFSLTSRNFLFESFMWLPKFLEWLRRKLIKRKVLPGQTTVPIRAGAS